MQPTEPNGETGQSEEIALLDRLAASLDEVSPNTASIDAALAVLLLRDHVAHSVASKPPDTPDQVQRLLALDQRLKDLIAELHESLPAEQFAKWRATLQPATNAWWWNPEAEAETRSFPRFILPFVDVLAVSVLIALVADLARRFLAEAPDDACLWYLGCQSALAILTGAAFTSAGARWLERAVKRGPLAGLPRWLPKMAVLAVSSAAVLTCWFRLDRIALYYQNRGAILVGSLQQAAFLGMLAKTSRDTTAGMADLRRAISIFPQLASAHYSLGYAYDTLGDYDKALAEYRTAMAGEEVYLLACNNAARILIRKKDYGGALQLLWKAKSMGDVSGRIGYAIWKNLGFAHLRLNQPLQAEPELQQALALYPDGADAHCLMAELLDSESKLGANEQRDLCITKANSVTDDAELQSAAQEKDLLK